MRHLIGSWSWAVAAQAAGAAMIALAIAVLAGLAWGALAVGAQLLVGGALAETPAPRDARPADPTLREVA